MSERELQSDALERWGAHPKLRLFRMNVGVGWFANGKPARQGDPGAYPVKFGIPGFPDVFGIAAPLGRFVALEFKTERGTQSDRQRVFERVVLSLGGVYAVCRSMADVDAALIPLVGAP